MIVRLAGLLAELREESVVVERDGVGYEVLVPRFAAGELAASRGRTITLHTLEYYEGNAANGSLVPRIVGFLHPEDRAFFELLITVKGIGVRKALRALAEPTARIARMIDQADASGLAKLHGLGRRSADQIIAELRAKVRPFAAAGGPEAAAVAEWSQSQRDAIEVLVGLGDPRQDAERWVARAAQLHPELASADEWLRAAYRVRSGAEG